MSPDPESLNGEHVAGARNAPIGRDTGRRTLQAMAVQAAAVAAVYAVWPRGLEAWQLWFVLAIGLAANLLQPTYSLVEGSRTPHDRATGAQIVWTVYAVQVLALAEWLWRQPTTGMDPVSVAAAALMAAGLVLRTWAVRTLGRFFTWNVEVQGGQTVIEEGPYRRVRHPSYTGAFMMFWGATVVLHAWYVVPVACVALLVAFRRRIGHEEALLAAEIPGYADYMKRTGALLPRLR
ncbi:MAG: isoprenylcysteine carboxylmethyltransferase family protein [Candidatus Sericytochromatia bacterium]|nr:isoprenylcysteine carboxylmethyltransferase family protein [Candidatus Sericytochromatia bacterium]